MVDSSDIHTALRKIADRAALLQHCFPESLWRSNVLWKAGGKAYDGNGLQAPRATREVSHSHLAIRTAVNT